LKFAGGAPLAATLEGEFSDVTRFRPAKVTRDLRRFADAGTGVRGSTFMGPASENLHINTAANSRPIQSPRRRYARELRVKEAKHLSFSKRRQHHPRGSLYANCGRSLKIAFGCCRREVASNQGADNGVRRLGIS
jgi:hypothetical protein